MNAAAILVNKLLSETEYPDQYCLIRDEKSGEETIIPLSSTQQLDIERIVKKWVRETYGGELRAVGIGRVGSGLADYSAEIYIDGRAPGVAVWDSTGFWLE